MPHTFGFTTVVNDQFAAAIRQAQATSACHEDAFFKEMVSETSLGKTMTRALEAMFGKQSTEVERNWHLERLALANGDLVTGKFFNVLF